MKPDPTNLLKSLGISNPIIGFYDTPEKGKIPIRQSHTTAGGIK